MNPKYLGLEEALILKIPEDLSGSETVSLLNICLFKIHNLQWDYGHQKCLFPNVISQYWSQVKHKSIYCTKTESPFDDTASVDQV